MTSRSARFVEWLLRRHALAVARAGVPAPAPEKVELLRRGELALQLADRTLDPVDPLRSGPAPFLALDLYRIAAYFHLAAAAPASDAPDLRSVWDASPDDLLSSAAAGSEGRARIAKVLVSSTVIEDAALPAEEQRRRAEDARAFVQGLARLLEGRDRAVARLQVQRYLRIALVVALVASTVFAGVELYARRVRPTDLAAGKPFVVSSALEDADFDPIGHTISHGTVPLLFHTNEELNPWVEFDLGSVQRIGSVEVVNRSDCCTERAAPLVIEVSTDHGSYVEVGRCPEAFSTWRATFPAREARWVKLRVPRRTWLHLERVSIYAF